MGFIVIRKHRNIANVHPVDVPDYPGVERITVE